MKVKRSQVRWGFWLWCVLVTTVGWLVGFIMGFALGSGTAENIGHKALGSTLAYFMLGASLGSVVSLMQWIVLRRHVSGIGSWIMAGTVGMGIAGGTGYGAAVLVFGYSEGLEGLGSAAAVVGWTVVAAFGGSLTGILQWRVLRRYIRGAGWWVLASTLGWSLSFAANGTINAVGFLSMPESWPAYSAAWFFGGLIAGGVVLGSIIGGALVWLLNYRAIEV